MRKRAIFFPVHQWPEVWRHGLVAGVEIEAIFEGRGKDRVQIGTTKKLKLSDRARRMEALGRHVSVAAFRDTLEVKVAVRGGQSGAKARCRLIRYHSRPYAAVYSMNIRRSRAYID